MYLKLQNGMITNFHSAPDLYVGGLQLIPEVSVIPRKLRLGVIAGAFYTNKKLQAAFGPTLAFKLKTFNAGPFGSAANLHLTLDHLWGTDQQKLFGGGLHIDLLNKIIIGFTVHRDYNLNSWWIQSAIGILISKLKKTVELFNP